MWLFLGEESGGLWRESFHFIRRQRSVLKKLSWYKVFFGFHGKKVNTSTIPWVSNSVYETANGAEQRQGCTQTHTHRDIHASLLWTIVVCARPAQHIHLVWFYTFMDVWKRDLVTHIHSSIFVLHELFYTVLICSQSLEYTRLTLNSPDPNKIIICLHNIQRGPWSAPAGWAVIEHGKESCSRTDQNDRVTV